MESAKPNPRSTYVFDAYISKRVDVPIGFIIISATLAPHLRECAQPAALFAREPALRAILKHEASRRQQSATAIATPGLSHHNIFYGAEFRGLEAGKLNDRNAVRSAHRCPFVEG